MYSGFVTEVSRHLCALLFEARAKSGIRARALSFPIGDLLRTVPAIREWEPSETPLVLDAKELKEADPATRNLLQEISARRELGLVNYARRGTKHVYTFNPHVLKTVLGDGDLLRKDKDPFQVDIVE